MKKMILILTLITAFTGFVSAQNMIELDKMDFEWNITGDKLTIAVEAETKGWIAVGLGSSRMDGSVMFIGYSDKGEAFFEEHLGRGHSHSKTNVQRPVEYKVSESNGSTMMEFTVDKSDFVTPGKDEIQVIVAYGARDNFRSIHRYRDSAVIRF